MALVSHEVPSNLPVHSHEYSETDHVNGSEGDDAEFGDVPLGDPSRHVVLHRIIVVTLNTTSYVTETFTICG